MSERVVKARAWDIVHKEYVAIKEITWNEQGEIVEVNTATYVHFPLEKKTVIIEWFTGKLDKDKTEIYQGDIFDVDDGGRRCEVVWFDPQACFDTKLVAIIDDSRPFAALENSHWSYRCKVIGSIHGQEGEG